MRFRERTGRRIAAAAVLLLLGSSACRRAAEEPPAPSALLPVAACTLLRAAGGDLQLMALYGRVADQIVAGEARDTPLLPVAYPEALLKPGADIRGAVLFSLNEWLDFLLRRQQALRDGLRDAWLEPLRREAGADEFRDDFTRFGARLLELQQRFGGALLFLSDAFRQGWDADPHAGQRAAEAIYCDGRRAVDLLYAKYGCDGVVARNAPTLDQFALISPADFPYVTWTALGLPQCEPGAPSPPSDCVAQAWRKPFLPRCDRPAAPPQKSAEPPDAGAPDAAPVVDAAPPRRRAR